VLDTKDFNLCTPLHVAILNGQLECLRLLLEAGAETSVRCEGSPLLVLAVSVGALPDLRDFALAAVELLLQHSCSPWDRDENGRLALHWAAEVGLSEVVPVLIAKGIAEMRADHGDDGVDPLLMIAVEDDEGDTPLHLAAVAQQSASLRALISHYNLVPPLYRYSSVA
jgi:ankyrin repeat protein